MIFGNIAPTITGLLLLVTFLILDFIGDLLGPNLDYSRPPVARGPARPVPRVHHPADGGPVHHGHLLLFAGTDVLDGIFPVLAVHVHFKGEHDHGDGEPGQRDNEHAAQ